MKQFLDFIFKRFNKKSKINFISIAVISIVINVVMVIIPILQKKIIDQVGINSFDKKSIIFLCIISLTGSIAIMSESTICNQLFIYLKKHLQKELLESSLRKKNKIIDEKGPGAYMVSIFGDSEQIANILQNNYFSTIILCISTVITLIISLEWSLVFSIIVIPTYIILTFSTVICNKVYIKYSKAGRELIYKLNPMVLEYIENKKSILGYANINSYETEIDTLFTDRDKYFKVAFFAQSISKSLTDSIKNISIIVFFILSISEILKGNMEISSFIAMLTYFSRIYAPMTSIQEWSASLSKFKMVHQKIEGSLDIPLNLGINEDDELIFEECTFSYENEKEILNKFSLNVDAKIGIVGLSGEGKSTILKLMMGDVKPTKGKCTYGKKSTFDISKLIINSNLRIYSQEPEIFNDTLKFNITLGKIGVSHQEFDIETIKIKEALKNLFDKINKSQSDIIIFEDEKALLKDIYLLTNNQLKDKEVLNNIYNSINNHKLSLEMLSSILCDRKYYIIEKYDEIISELEIEYLDGRDLGQRGGSISGGEKNKICLARFLLPNHKGYFILDEPFTSLDILSEKKCMKVLKKYILGSKGIIISHKLDIIEELCDKIIVLNDGITIENGTHKELIKLNGLYKELFINSSRKDKNFIC